MNYEEALAMSERLEPQVVGCPVKGMFVESLFIGPTDWTQMNQFMTLQLQRGGEAALREFSRKGYSLSVYGVAKAPSVANVPGWNLTLLDDWELTISN